MSTKKETVIEHFVSTDLGVGMRKPDPYRIAISWAFAVWAYVGKDKEFTARRAAQENLSTGDVAALSGIGYSTAKKYLNAMAKADPPEVERIQGRRYLGEKTTWRLISPPMRWQLAKKMIELRLPQVQMPKVQLPLLESIRIPRSHKGFEQSGTTERVTGSHVARHPVPGSQTNIKILDQVLDPKEGDLPAEAGQAPSLQELAAQLRSYFGAAYKVKHSTRMTIPKRDWLAGAELDLVDQHGLENMKSRVDNYFSDPLHRSHSYPTFLSRPDEWLHPREIFTRGKKDEVKVLTPAQLLAQEMGIEVDNES